jgi:dihydrolipoamide dehydrogenase
MTYDLAVIGGGPGGYAAAIRGAQHGLKVLLVEKDTLGGTCLNRGCIPTKCFVYDSKLLKAAKISTVLTGNDSLAVDPLKMITRKRSVVKTMVDGLAGILRSNGIEIIQGRGTLLGPGKLQVQPAGGPARIYKARNIILANGSKPARLPFIGVDGHFVQTTDEALDAEDLPRDLIIIGGGVIGVEMATIFLNLGVQVALIELLPDILNTEDREVRNAMRRLLSVGGATLHLNAKAKDFRIVNDRVMLTFEDAGGNVNTLEADRLLVATGRTPVFEGIDLKELRLATEGPFIKVNERLQTNLPNVYAIGDVIGGMMLAHKASAEAEAALENILGRKKEIIPQHIPRCIWGLEEIGAVGLNEEEARATGRRIKIGRFPYTASSAAQAMGNTTGFAKVIADSENGEILGFHVMGEHATDLVGYAVVTMTMESAVEDLAGAIQAHPTLSETVMEAALDWNGLAVHLPRR